MFPYAGYIERRFDQAGANLSSEQAVQKITVKWQKALRKDRIAEALRFLQDALIETRVMMVRTPKHDQADIAALLQLVQGCGGLYTQICLKGIPRRKGDVHRARVLLPVKSKKVLPGRKHLKFEEVAIRKIQDRLYDCEELSALLRPRILNGA